MSGANSQLPAARVCFSILVFAIALYLSASVHEIDRDLKRDPDWRTYFTKDAMHYYIAAEAFASGDFSMSYEKGWPYRQPLLPLLVAGVMKVTNANLFAIRMINVLVIAIATISLFLILRGFWSDSVTAAIVSILFVLNPFVYDQAVRGLNTEPIHLFLLICIVACFLRYLRTLRWVYLWLLSLTIGLDYLDRINGSFLAIAAFMVLICFECSRYFVETKPLTIQAKHGDTALSSKALAKAEAHRTGEGVKLDTTRSRDRQTPSAKRQTPNVPWWQYALAVLILVAVTTPSWLSRLYYFGHPFYYGAVQNFLWGDTYLGSMDSPRMLTAADYFGSHSLLDAAGRFLLGCSKVFFIIPIDRERLPLLYFAALAGIWFAWRQRRMPYLWLLLFYGLQMLPLAWTQPVNTTPRIPYAATQPFELFFAAICVHWLWSKSLSGKSFEPENAIPLTNVVGRPRKMR
ncbi:MAG TPA: glycosyltransferase family 39 protein [Chthoniobacterales bacterium]|nr:glycosyltransferase family 39 protein [Chthoniobacterales bacterium]